MAWDSSNQAGRGQVQLGLQHAIHDAFARQGCRTALAAEPPLWPEAPWRVFCYGCLTDLGVGGADAPPNPKPDPGRGGRGVPNPKPDPPPTNTKSDPALPAEGPTEVVVACPACRCVFCFDCDTYIHESLHNCPGCEGRGEGKAEALDAAAEEGAGGVGNGVPDGRAFMDAG